MLTPAIASVILAAGSVGGNAAAAPPAGGNPVRWEIISNANEIRGLAVLGNRLYAATGGGVAAWDVATGKLLRKWTSIDGVLGTRAYAITACPMPEPTIVVGTVSGLSLYDPVKQRWTSLTSYDSGLTAGNVTALASDPRRNLLYVGHGYAGLDIFDARRKVWRHLATVDGLPANRVEAIAVSPTTDQVWVACRTGVAMLGGGSMSTWTMSQIGIKGELTGAATVDATGTAWFVASTGHLLRFARGAWKIYGPDRLGGALLKAEAGIAATPDGAVWFVTSAGRLCRFDAATERCVPRVAAPDATGLLAGSGGALWVATTRGVRALSASDPAAERSFTVPDDILGSNHVVALAQDRAGTVWIATTAGTFVHARGGTRSRLSPLAAPGEKIGPGRVLTLYADPRGGMWFGTTAGAASYDGSRWRRLGRAQGLVGDSVFAITRDAGGRMWFGTSRGVTVWDGKSARSITARDGLRSEEIHSLFARGDAVWAGAREWMYRFEGGRVECLDDEVLGVEFETMRMIAAYGSDSLLLGSSNGLAYLGGRTGRDDPEIYGDAVGGIAMGPGGDLWVGTEMRGLFHREGGAWANLTTRDGLPSDFVTALLVDRGGVVWIGTADAGLARYRP